MKDNKAKPKTVISADLHLGDNIWRSRGFQSSQEHDECIYNNLVNTVEINDTLVLLGDICANQKWLSMIGRIECKKKILILGNRDSRLPIKALSEVFDEVHSSIVKNKVLFTHIPVHESEFKYIDANIHGHLHKNMVHDRRYMNISVDRNYFKPFILSDLVRSLRNEGLLN